MARAIVGIGSSKGRRSSAIGRAVALLGEAFPEGALRCSRVIETPAWGYESDARYLNACVSFDTDLPPEELLSRLLAIQNSIDSSPHRDADGNYIDRVIDIDLIALGTLRYSSPSLTLPHPRAHLRSFVTIPFMEIESELCFRVCAMLTDSSL